jgi:hypothetical protein
LEVTSKTTLRLKPSKRCCWTTPRKASRHDWPMAYILCVYCSCC